MAAKPAPKRQFGGIIKLASSAEPLDILLKQLHGSNARNGTVQIFDPAAIINATHLNGAYYNALESFKEKTNVSKSVSMEMLLFAGMTDQISDAIKIAGAKSAKKFVVFASTLAAYNRIKPRIKNVKAFAPTAAQQLKTAKRYGITQAKELDHFVLQRMTLSRLND